MNHPQKDPFSRSYGARLPSSLTRFLSRALVFSTFLPVSVLVRLPIRFARSYFLAAWPEPIRFTRRIHVLTPFGVSAPVHFAAGTSYGLRPPHGGRPSLLRRSIAQTPDPWYRNIEPVSHHLRLAASTKGPTNPGRTNLPQETSGFRRQGFSPCFSLLMSA